MHDVYVNNSARDAALFHAFFDHAHAPLLVVDEKLHVVEANSAARETLGLVLDGVTESNLLSGFWQVSATAVMRMIDGVRRQIPVVPVVVRTALDRLVEVDAFIVDEDGPPLIGVIVTDRSGVDDAQRRLKDQEERYRSLFEWAPVAMREEDFTAVGVWLDRLRADGVTDLEGHLELNPDEVERAVMSIRTTRVNAATVDMLKAPSILAVLRGFRHDELTPQVLDAFTAQFVTLWDGGTDHRADFFGVNYLGEPFECRLTWTVPKTNGGRDLSRVVVSLLDLTPLRATERRLQRLVADKDRFIASVSHELRTPLSTVLGLSEELATNWDRFDEEETQELIGLIAQQSADLGLLVEDLLVAANLEAGRVAINPEIIDLRAIVGAVLEDCAQSQPELGLVEIEGQLTSCFADPLRVRQIVRNLLTNANRYGGDRISIGVGCTDRPYVRVHDDGEGISFDHREAIFVPYFQATGTKRVLGSLGLGLAISRELARRMDGELSYRYDDGISVFQLDLPSV